MPNLPRNVDYKYPNVPDKQISQTFLNLLSTLPSHYNSLSFESRYHGIMQDLYIPTPGFAFRLLGLDNDCVLAGRDGGLVNYPKSDIYADQWRTLDAVSNKGIYYIKSTYIHNDGRVMFSKPDSVGIFKPGSGSIP